MSDGTRLSADHSFEDGQGHLLPDAEAGLVSRAAVVLQAASPRAIEWTAERLIAGGVIAMPTDTVYGIFASLAHEEAIQRIFTIKGRPLDRPLPVLVSSTEALDRIALDLDERVKILLDRFWPGPLTVALPVRPGVPPGVLADDGTVGVRLPNHPLTIEVIEKAGGAVACTSANRSGEQPAVTAAEVAARVDGRIDLVLDGGQAPGGVPSTVVAVVENELRVLRGGAIGDADLAAAWRLVCSGIRNR